MKQILDKIKAPPGALPKRAQTWVLLGLTLLMALIMVTVPGPPGEAPGEGSDTAADPGEVEPSVQARSVENGVSRLREEAARRADRRLRVDLGMPEARSDGLPHPPEAVEVAPAPYSSHDAGASAPSVEEEIEREERLRRYRSLSTPSLVRTVRDSGGDPVPEPASNSPSEVQDGADTETAPAETGGVPGPAPPRETPTSQDADGSLYRLRAGQFLEAVLTNRLNGEFAGPVNAMVVTDTYDRSRQHRLVPAGTHAIGTASRVEDWDQARLAVVFHLLQFPDGRSVGLGDSVALNQVGETGLKDRVSRRYGSIVAVSGALGALSGLSQAVSPQQALLSRLGAARISAGAGLSQAAERILERYLNRMPKVTIREGHRLRIYLTEELMLPAYPIRDTWASRGTAVAVPRPQRVPSHHLEDLP